MELHRRVDAADGGAERAASPCESGLKGVAFPSSGRRGERSDPGQVHDDDRAGRGRATAGELERPQAVGRDGGRLLGTRKIHGAEAPTVTGESWLIPTRR